MRVLVVGGAGYIGSVTAQTLVQEGHDVIIFDNFSRGHREAIPSGMMWMAGDMSSREDLSRAFAQKVDAVMHFAALSQVGESVEKPDLYFHNNVSNGLNLLDAMLEYGVDKFIFSSTAAVYGEPSTSPITEDFPLLPTSPYGDSKLAFERVLKWYANAYKMRYVSLRYFNASGAAGEAGEDHEPETHLIPLVLQVALGRRKKITIFGDDYPTPDGTCIRDYIHVKDLADAHVQALTHLANTGENQIFNLGQGNGSSVREVIEVARKITGHPIPAEIGRRRAGDPSILVASNELIHNVLGWAPKYSDLQTIIGDAWAWHQTHPQGYVSGRKVA
jgi:UDP-glucose 4-epimerase